MVKPDDSREEALRRLDERADALAARTARPASAVTAAHGTAIGQAYRIIAELIGGAVVGLALGAGADWLFGTAPIGLIAGVLLGFALAVYMAKRTADRLMAQAAREAASAAGGPRQDG